MLIDLFIRNGRIIDGAGSPWYRGDVAVKGDRIAAVGRLRDPGAARTIDAAGLVVCPGFVDAHSHSDMTTLSYPEMESNLVQGVTTLVAGKCGLTPAPTSPLSQRPVREHLGRHVQAGQDVSVFQTFRSYLDEEEKYPLGVNVAHLVGHCAVRAAAMGYDNRDPTPAEIEEMRRLVAEAMEAGAYGLSSGLIYPPGIYAKTPELVELAKVSAQYGGVYDTHIRNEGEGVTGAVEEAIRIGEEAGCPIQISHFKVASPKAWGRSAETLRLVEEARRRGVDVTFDQYPYTAGSTSLATLLPPWAHEGGNTRMLERLRDPEQRARMLHDIEAGLPGWENMAGDLGWGNIIVSSVKTQENKPLEGLNMTEIKDARGEPDEWAALWRLLLEEAGAPKMIIVCMDEAEVERIMRSPNQMVGSDSLSGGFEGVNAQGKPHPRYYGTFPRVLARYVRERLILTLEDAVRRMTGFPAQRFSLTDRGILRPGMAADITVFDPEAISDTATYKEPHRRPEGIPYVVVNGKLVVEDGKTTGVLAGRTLRKRA